MRRGSREACIEPDERYQSAGRWKRSLHHKPASSPAPLHWVVIMPQVELPQELIEKFEKSGFCPHDAVRGRPETGTAWNTLEIEYDPGSESSYSGTSMFYVCHWNGKTTKAERPWGEMSGKHDGEFIKAVVDWFQSMTQARS
jgi:hypothetical protein